MCLLSSIIIPTYERRDQLFETLKALSYISRDERFEVILIDDGSKNALTDELLEYRKCYPIKYIYMKRVSECGSIARVRNIGYENSSGDIIIFLDSDMLIMPDFVEKVRSFFKMHDNMQHILQVGFRNNLKKSARKVPPEKYKPSDYTYDERCDLLDFFQCPFEGLSSSWTLAYGHTMAIKRETIEMFGLFDTGFTGWGLEDTELAYRYKKGGAKVLYNPDITAFHQWHPVDYDRQRCEGWFINLNKFYNKYPFPEISALTIMREGLDEERRRKLMQKKILNSRFYCMCLYESYLRGRMNAKSIIPHGGV